MEKKLAIIIEDDENQAEIFNEAVQEAGYKTERFNRGVSALERLNTGVVPHLIVLDMHLSDEVSGDHIMDVVVEGERFSDMYVIIASADAGLSTVQGLKRDKKILLLQKPVSYEQLMNLSHRVLSR